MKIKTFCFDLDNTLCNTISSQYEKSKPNKNAIKVVRELGSERRETVRSLSAMRVEELRGVDPSTRGPG